MLRIRNLHARVGHREILRGINLSVDAGQIHAVMGPNGSGKSTLARVLAGHPEYEVTEGEVLYQGQDLLAMDPETRARAGVFMAFQYPVEIPGVNNAYFLKAALNALRKHRGEEELDAMDFLALVRDRTRQLDIDESLMNRPVNEGFSGGEKKRNEVFQMAMLEPVLAILDETDSGLDIDALKVVARGVNAMRSPSRAFLTRDALPATARLRCARHGARAGRRSHREVRRQGTGARAGGQGVRLARAGPRRSGPFGPDSRNMTKSYAIEFEAFQQARRSGEPAWLADRRLHAMQRFQSVGFPTTRDEDWRFTSLAAIAQEAFALGAASPLASGSIPLDVTSLRIPVPLSAELVFVNGHYTPALSFIGALPTGARIESLASSALIHSGEIESHLGDLASFAAHPLAALNTAFLEDGACIWLPARTILEDPIHVIFISVPGAQGPMTMSHPRVLTVLGDQSQASIVETYAGPAGGRYFTNAVTEICLGQHAVLDHYKLQYESPQSFHVGGTHIQARRDASFTGHSISLGGSLTRNDVMATLDGEGVECALNGLYLADERRHVDNHTTIDHALAHCASREVYKGILADHARGVFNGKVIVRPDAQKTDAKQTNRALLLSEDAQINTKPQLEIFANDVKCTHGAAVGQLDDEAVFYLRSRGLSAADARRLLIHAFAAEVLSGMRLEPVRKRAEVVMAGQLSRVLEAA